jgi:hypothetical protein
MHMQEGEKLQIETPVFVSVLYLSDDGRIFIVVKTFTSKASVEGRPGSSFRVSAECGREVYATPSGKRRGGPACH